MDRKVKRPPFWPVAVVLALGAGAAALRPGSFFHERGPEQTTARPPAPRPAGPAELAVVAPLAVGSPLGGFTVRGIFAVRGGSLRVAAEREGDRVDLEIVLAGEQGPPPPATAGRYAIYYAIRHMRALGNEEAVRLAEALAAVVAKNGDVPPPEGMSTFAGLPESGPQL